MHGFDAHFRADKSQLGLIRDIKIKSYKLQKKTKAKSRPAK